MNMELCDKDRADADGQHEKQFISYTIEHDR